MWAIIGGSGFERFDACSPLENLNRETPFGLASSGLKRVKFFDEELLFVSRHGAAHELLPQEINYRANIFALKRAGASKILSLSSVGSLRQELAPGDLVIPNQYIDRTKMRVATFCGEGIVGHCSLANPVSHILMDAVASLSLDFPAHFGKTYLCMEGPAFSTKAESHSYRQIGADIIGMTNFPEYALAKEAGIAYLPCCFVTDYDSWNEKIAHVTLADVLALMKKNEAKSFTLVKELIQRFPHILPEGAAQEGLKNGLMTPWEHIPEDKKMWLKQLMQAPQQVQAV